MFTIKEVQKILSDCYMEIFAETIGHDLALKKYCDRILKRLHEIDIKKKLNKTEDQDVLLSMW